MLSRRQGGFTFVGEFRSRGHRLCGPPSNPCIFMLAGCIALFRFGFMRVFRGSELFCSGVVVCSCQLFFH